MIFSLSQIYKLLIITLALCCLISAVDGGRLLKTHNNADSSDIATSTKAEVTSTVTKATAVKESNKKTSQEDTDDDDDDDDDNDDEEDDDDTAAEKTAVQPAADTSLSFWGIAKGFWNWIKGDFSQSLFGYDDDKTSAVGEGRTFGKIRRLQMALIPIAFKFGILSAMVAFLVAIGIKTLFLVKILVIMNLLAILAKFFTLKSNFGYVEHTAPAHGWTPYANNGWQSPHAGHNLNKDIHLHLHDSHGQHQVSAYATGGSGGHGNGWERNNGPYSAYDTIELQGERNDQVPVDVVSESPQYNENVPINHRIL